jgi:hypothetical protein
VVGLVALVSTTMVEPVAGLVFEVVRRAAVGGGAEAALEVDAKLSESVCAASERD